MVVTCEVVDVKEAGIDVKIVGTDQISFIKRSELARDRSEQRPDRFAVGQKVDARVITVDRRTHKVTVSIKALEVAEEKEAIAQYGSSDSGATLGDILGTALKRKENDKEDEEEKYASGRGRIAKHRGSLRIISLNSPAFGGEREQEGPRACRLMPT